MASTRVERRGAVLVLTLDRPHAMNAIDHATAVEIADALELLDTDDDLAAGVITGGTKVFCAGADLKALDAEGGPYAADRGFAGLVERPPRKPLIAAVEGWALGGGFEITLACDMVTASETARFGLPEVKLGLTAGGGGAIRLAKTIPRALALEMLLTGEPIDAAEAHRLGLVNRLVPAGQALDAAIALAAAVAGNSPLAVPAVKQVARESITMSDAEAFAYQAPILDPVRFSDDTRRRVAAFAERRAPRQQQPSATEG
jgi:enoyl-CoA hydratase